jgi:hypothetical protein
LVFVSHPDAVQEEQITIPFKLPAAVAFEEHGKHTTEYAFPGKPAEIERFESSAVYSVRATSEGFTVVQSPGSTKRQPPADLQAMVSALSANATLSYDLDHRGRLLRVRGYEAMMEQLTSEFGKMMRAMAQEAGLPRDSSRSGAGFMESMLGPLGITKGNPTRYLMQQWNNRQIVGFQAGETVPLEKILTATEDLPVPGGSVSVNRATKVSVVDCNTRKCVRLLQISDFTDTGQALTGMVRSMLGGALNYVGRGSLLPKDLGYANVKLSTTLVRDIDAQTGLIFSDMNGMEISCTIVSPDGRDPVTMKRTSYFSYKRI